MRKAPDWLPYWVVILIQMKMMTIMIRMRNQKDLMVTTISKKTMMNKKMERAHLRNLVHLGKFYDQQNSPDHCEFLLVFIFATEKIVWTSTVKIGFSWVEP